MMVSHKAVSKFLHAWITGLALAVGAAGAVRASPDEGSGRAGRVVQADGRAWIYDTEQRQWQDAWRNRALTEGDRVSTDRDGRVQLAVGSTELRLAGDTEIDFERLDDDRFVLRVARGSLAVRVRSRDVARELEIRAADVRVYPRVQGHYRVDRYAPAVVATVWRGSVDVESREQRVTVDAGRSLEVVRDGRAAAAVAWREPDRDAFSDWVARDERADDRETPSARYVSPEMTGADELDRYGRWERHPEFGMVWMPGSVSVDWAPYREGRWTWHVRWGWTWVDEAPWGFVTSHYGRWSNWRGRWVWVPGTYAARPVFAPALVAWVGSGGSGVGVSVGIGGGPAVGWLPLAPWEVYVPPFRHPQRYFDRVNPPRRPGVPPQVPTGPVSYGNHGVPNAVTVVPVDVLRGRQPVAPSVLRDPDLHRRLPREPFHATPPVGVIGGPGRFEREPGGAQVVRPQPAPGPAMIPPTRQPQPPAAVPHEADPHPNRPTDVRPQRPQPVPGGFSPTAPVQRPVPEFAVPRPPQAGERVQERPVGRPGERAPQALPPGQVQQPVQVPQPMQVPQPVQVTQPMQVPQPVQAQPPVQGPQPPRVAVPERLPRAVEMPAPQAPRMPQAGQMGQPAQPAPPAAAPQPARAPVAPAAASPAPAPAPAAQPRDNSRAETRRDGVLKDAGRDGARERRERE